MGDADDFTFCQVGLQVDSLESPNTIPNISNITLEDNRLDGVSTRKIDNSILDDKSHDSTTTKELASTVPITNNSTDMLPPKVKLNESLKQKTVEETGVSVNRLEDQKSVIKKPAVRAKVPFEKGYSPMDWLKLTRTGSDLAGLKGQSNRRLISMSEVRQHKSEGSIWTVLKGRVYNISPYMKFHPGGVDMLMKAAGKDCTSLFNKYHAWVNAEFLLEKCLVGVLDDSL